MTQQPTLVIMAAGMGSRFGGLKQMTPIDPQGQFIIDYSLYDAYQAGFRRVVFIIKHALEAAFHETVGARMQRFFDVAYVFQETDVLPDGFSVPEGRVKPWGTAHAVACCRNVLDGPFAVVNSDDFYGRGAYRAMYDFLCGAPADVPCAMVGYLLRNTVTEFGSVSRGVCREEHGLLKSVEEHTKIFKRGQDAEFTTDGTHFTFLPGDTVVSMNFWGFRENFAQRLWDGFPAFLRENLPQKPDTCEYYLPIAVNACLQTGELQAKVLPCTEAWHGVTYHEDLPELMRAVAELKEQGVYPCRLWEA